MPVKSNWSQPTGQETVLQRNYPGWELPGGYSLQDRKLSCRGIILGENCKKKFVDFFFFQLKDFGKKNIHFEM